MSEDLVKIYFNGVGLTNATEKEILEYIAATIEKQQKPYYIVTPNPEILLYAKTHPDFKQVLNNAKIALTDGMQLYRAMQFVGRPVKERIIGTNFVENLCEKVANRPITVGFLGARGKIAEKASECLRQKYPKLKVVFASDEWEAKNGTTKIDVLFVAFGFPKQETWMANHVGRIPVKVMVGVGGAFDQIVNPSLRPPQLVNNLGLGWLYRLMKEPWRIKRQIKL